ncbi:MAG TPA: TadE/TadG family type IV pilus assembly protein [Xanthobacteraceae bacterium]|nr:TadE/TadG family type IV pilus assembly protein [Xanthobacteraceae bacterium]
MTATRAFSGWWAQLRRFARDRDAVSALEFAIVLPFMLTLYIGGVELGDGLQINFKVAETARTVTDLASQYATIESADMSNILGASSAVIAPYPAANMIMTVSEVTTNGNGQGTITWSCSLNGTAHTVGSSVTLPANLQSPNITLIWGEVTYPYTPSTGYVITGTITMYQSTYFYPRLVTSITLPQGC